MKCFSPKPLDLCHGQNETLCINHDNHGKRIVKIFDDHRSISLYVKDGIFDLGLIEEPGQPAQKWQMLVLPGDFIADPLEFSAALCDASTGSLQKIRRRFLAVSKMCAKLWIFQTVL